MYFSLFSINSFLTISFLISTLVGTLLSVAYYTLFERKVLAAMQRRRGPNVVGIYGLLQPIADGVKLMSKEGIKPWLAVSSIYTAAPMVSIVFSFVGWSVLPSSNTYLINISSNIDIIIFFCITSLGGYGVILAGWGSFSRYAVMGALRGLAQLISYEVVLLLLIIPIASVSGSFSFSEISTIQGETCWFLLPFLPSAFIFFIILLAETNRTPFDLPEAEAELVSGFNVEYSSMLFAMFSLAEYNSMLLMSSLFSILFLGAWSNGLMFFSIKVLFIAFLIVQVRAALPRYRYDQLMSLCWYIFLPISVALVSFYTSLVVLFSINLVKPETIFWEIENNILFFFNEKLF